MRPKHHYALHLPGMLRRFGLLLSTLTMERRHRVVKRYTRPRQNSSKWDLSIVEEVTAHQLWELEGSSGSFLTGRTSAAPRARVAKMLRELVPGIELAHECLVHNRVDVKDGGACLRDAVFFDSDGVNCAGELLLNFSADGHAYSIVSAWHARPAGAVVAWGGVRGAQSSVATVHAYGLFCAMLGVQLHDCKWLQVSAGMKQ